MALRLRDTASVACCAKSPDSVVRKYVDLWVSVNNADALLRQVLAVYKFTGNREHAAVVDYAKERLLAALKEGTAGL